jgi:cell division septation protein DedD
MDFKFDAGSKGDAAPQGQDKGRQTVLLVVLLLLLGGFGYLYFFTGLIRPQEQAAPPQPVPQVVKQPLPARDGVQSQMSSAVQTAAPAAPTMAPAQATTPAATSSAVPAKAPAVVKPAAPAAKPVAQKPVVDAKSTAKPAQAAKAEPIKPVAALKPAATPKVAEKKAAAPKASPKPAATAAKVGGPWTVVVGSYVLEEKLAADMARVKAAGLTPVMTSGQRHMTTMHRLKYADYADRDTAQQAVELLKRTGGDGFVMQKAGKYEVFAGSYAQLTSAQAEQQRLANAGIKVSLQKSQVGVPSRKLTAGTYTDRKVAESTLKKLKQAGIGTPVLE